MPWKKSFDRREALEKTMMVFWRNGYENTSVADIVTATGASRYGLYDEFGDKHALYLAALDYYEKNPVTWLLGDLEKDGAGLAELYGYRDRLTAGTAKSFEHLGCLMTSAATDLCPHDPAVCATVDTFLRRVHTAISKALDKAKSDGDWVSTLSPDEAAEIILSAVQGAAVFARANVPPQNIARMLRNTFGRVVSGNTDEPQ